METNMQKRGRKPKPDTRDNLIKAGVKMLHESGYTASGVKEIVDAAGVPKGSFYNHFKSKETFGQEVIDCYFNQSLEGLKALLSDKNVAPLQRLKNYFDARIKGFSDSNFVRGCLLGNMSLEIADHSTKIREHIAKHFETWETLLQRCITDAQSQGSLRNKTDAADLANFILNSWEGAMLRMRVVKNDIPLQQFKKIIFESLLV